jgi:hypothetical protein
MSHPAIVRAQEARATLRKATDAARIASDAEFANSTEANQAAAWRAHCAWRKAKNEATVASAQAERALAS